MVAAICQIEEGQTLAIVAQGRGWVVSVWLLLACPLFSLAVAFPLGCCSSFHYLPNTFYPSFLHF